LDIRSRPIASLIPSSAHAITLRYELESVSSLVEVMNLKPRNVSISPCTSAFHTSYGFPRRMSPFVVWTIPSSAWDAHRLVSTPSLSGLARDYHLTDFPEFDEVSSNCRQLDRQSIYRVVICTCHRGVIEQVFDLLRSDRDVFGYRWIDAAVVESLSGFNKLGNCQPSRRRTDAHAVGVARRSRARFPGIRRSQRRRNNRIINRTPNSIGGSICITARRIYQHGNLIWIVDKISVFVGIHCDHSTRMGGVRLLQHETLLHARLSAALTLTRVETISSSAWDVWRFHRACGVLSCEIVVERSLSGFAADCPRLYVRGFQQFTRLSIMRCRISVLLPRQRSIRMS